MSGTEQSNDRQDDEISFEHGRVDVDKLQRFLSQTYWAESRTLATVQVSLTHSLVVSAHRDGKMIGFARAASDRAVFAHIMDVVVWPEHRGRGLGRRLVAALLAHPELATVTHWYLRTRDAHGLYAGLGFEAVDDGYDMRLVK